MTDNSRRTHFAMMAVDFAKSFNTKFGEENVLGYHVQLTVPGGPSTGGGVQARQHITMINQGEGKTVVIGACNTAEKKAEVRTLEHVDSLFKKRYEIPFPVGYVAYSVLIAKMANFFEIHNYQVDTAKSPPLNAPASLPQ